MNAHTPHMPPIEALTLSPLEAAVLSLLDRVEVLERRLGVGFRRDAVTFISARVAGK